MLSVVLNVCEKLKANFLRYVAVHTKIPVSCMKGSTKSII